MATVKALFDQVIFEESANPFLAAKQTASGLILSKDMVMSQETGDLAKLDSIIGFGIVKGTGDKCEYVKEGDAIFYDRRSIRALPADEVLWQMSEKGLVGYIEAGNPALVEAYNKYRDSLDLEERTRLAKQQAFIEEQKAKEEKLKQEMEANPEKYNKGYFSIKIN